MRLGSGWLVRAACTGLGGPPCDVAAQDSISGPHLVHARHLLLAVSATAVVVPVVFCLLVLGPLVVWLGMTTWHTLRLRWNLQRGKVPAGTLFFTKSLWKREVPTNLVLHARYPKSTDELRAMDDESTSGECMVCSQRKRRLHAWVVFPCTHSMCLSCMCEMIKAQQAAAKCPLCRLTLLVKEGEEAKPAAERASIQLAASTGTATPEAARVAEQ